MVKFAAATHPTRVRRDAGEAAPGKVMQQNKKGTDFLRRCVLFLIGRKAGGYPVFLRKNKGKVLTFTGVNDILIT